MKPGALPASLMTGPQVGQARAARRKDPAEAGAAFEGFLVQLLSKEMRKTVPEGLFGSQAAEMFASVLDEEIAKRAAEGGGLGLGRQIAEHVARLQPPEGAPAAGPAVAEALQRARLPVAGGQISSDFGHRADPLHGGRRLHKGLDIAAPTGTGIHPVRPGTVVSVGERGGYGLAVEVDHGDGWTTLYAHCDSAAVTVGQRVVPERPIATVGSSGRSTGPHLHLEVRQDGRAVDPKQALGWR